jgi:hypothetical protein
MELDGLYVLTQAHWYQSHLSQTNPNEDLSTRILRSLVIDQQKSAFASPRMPVRLPYDLECDHFQFDAVPQDLGVQREHSFRQR